MEERLCSFFQKTIKKSLHAGNNFGFLKVGCRRVQDAVEVMSFLQAGFFVVVVLFLFQAGFGKL